MPGRRHHRLQRARRHGLAGRLADFSGVPDPGTRDDRHRVAIRHRHSHRCTHPGADLRPTTAALRTQPDLDAAEHPESRRQADAQPEPSAPKPAPVPPPPPPQSGTDAYESQILALVNAERSAAGLRPLAAQTCPDGFAEPWSPHMAAEGRLSHQSLNPVLSRCGGHAAAENVGMNSSASPGDMVAGFMGSPPHRANILNGSYTGIGIGAYRDARGVWWVTQDFVG